VDSHRSSRVSFPRPRQELGDTIGWVAINHAPEHVFEVGVGFDVIQLARFDERADRRPACAAAVGSGEEMVLAAKSNGADRALDGIRIKARCDRLR